MSSFGVVLDACVLIPAAPRDTLLRAAEKGLYRLCWSRDILEEVQRNLAGKVGITEEKARRLVHVMEQQFPEALVEGYEPLIAVMTNDPKDRHVLAAAVKAGAQVIVTTNLRHFCPEDTSGYSIEAQSPDAFLVDLYDLAPDTMVDVLQEQAASLSSPVVTVDQVLERLALVAPEFSRTVRPRLARTTRHLP